MERKKPYPPTVEEIKTLMVDYKAPGVMAPAATKKKMDGNDQGVAFVKQEWMKEITCFVYKKKRHLIGQCNKTTKKERRKVWDTKKKEFQGRSNDASTSSRARR
jgi:hypothetical protein